MKRHYLLAAAALAMVSGTAANAATAYTSDPNITHFDALGEIGTFTSFPGGGDVGAPYTPTKANIDAGLRVIGNGNDGPIVVSFSQAYSTIEVLPNIDHYGDSYDGYQYKISGCNGDCLNADGTAKTGNFSLLFNALTATGSGEPFTLGTFTGTAPYLVNNVLTPGAGPGGTVGYEAFFQFGTAYQYYTFGASDLAVGAGNADEELTAVEGVPEPAVWTMLIAGFGMLGFALRSRRKAGAIATV
jgi:hypothetical protein